jgi:hypothetical protein
MNEPEKFLERWSRRKREATEEAVAPSKPKESETEKTPDPTAMAGFGPIEPGEVARLMAQFVLTPPPEEKLETSAKAETPREPEAASAAELASVAEAPTQSDDPKVPAIEADAAPQKDSDALPTIKSRVDDA